MKDYGQYILMGAGIFIFICAITLTFTWCGHHHERNEDNQLYPYHTSVVRTLPPNVG